MSEVIAVRVAWTTAEATAFGKLLDALEGTPGDDAFLGAEPLDAVNYWAFMSGGGDTTQMDAGVYSILTLDAQWSGVYAERSDCLDRVGAVLQMLSETSNLRRVGNVEFLRPVQNPTSPTYFPATDDSNPYWRIDLPLWFGVSTTVYN